MISTPITVSPEWVTQHAKVAAWGIGGLLAILISVALHFIKNGMEQFQKLTVDIAAIRENHLSHIEASTASTLVATAEIRDATLQTNTKLDMLIEIFKTKM